MNAAPSAADLAPAPTPSANDVRWFVCHTRPRAEKKFAALLAAEAFESYLPLVTKTRRYGARKRTSEIPLFPGYVFARVTLGLKSRLFQGDLLARVLPVDDERRFLRNLDDVKRIVAAGVEATLHPLIKRGTRVRVASGPLWGLTGVVDDPKNPAGIVVSVDVLQQGLLVRLPLEQLELEK